jgi:hypothetical protein
MDEIAALALRSKIHPYLDNTRQGAYGMDNRESGW